MRKLKGTRWIDNRLFILAGRVDNKSDAINERDALKKEWRYVRVIKYWQYDYALFVFEYIGGK